MNKILKTSCLLAILSLAPIFCICHTNNALVNDSNLVEELLLRYYAEEQLHITPSQYENLTAQQKAQFFSVGGWLRGIWNYIAGDDWGQYREPGHRGDGPYMTFQYIEYDELQMPII